METRFSRGFPQHQFRAARLALQNYDYGMMTHKILLVSHDILGVGHQFSGFLLARSV